MAQYIVYSGGANGYGLYDSHPNFPEEYRESVENLYVKQRIVATDNSEEEPFCYRFAPLKDRYLLSIIYKTCACDGEHRPFYATVNWLFTAKEIDVFWEKNPEQNIATAIQKSDEVLIGMGYRFPERQPINAEEDKTITENTRSALLTAAHQSLSAFSENRELSAQVFLGRAEEDDLFSPIFALLNTLPKYLRRHISFHIGAIAAEETKGVSLAITYNKYFELMSAKGNYNGSMAVRKIILIGDTFSAFSTVSSVATAYAQLSDDEKCRMEKLFSYSDNAEGYWKYILAVSNKNDEQISGAELALLIGEQGFLRIIETGVLSDKELLEIYAEKKKLAACPKLLEALEKKVAPIIQQLSYAQPKSKKKGAAKESKSQEKKSKKNKKEDKSEDKDYKKKGKHSVEKHERKDKKTNVKKPVYKKSSKKSSAVWTFVLRILIIASYWLGPVVLGVLTFVMGYFGQMFLSPKALLIAYAIQIALLILVAIPLGYIVIYLTQQEFEKIKCLIKKHKEEDEK